MEAAIRWSPHSTAERPRFLILHLVEKYLKFYEIESFNEDEQLDYKQISQHTKLPHVRAFDWSPTEEALVAVGLPSGEAHLLRIDDSSNDILAFGIKHQRPCNAIALSTRGLLAAGLDKVRNDFCLNIWDVNQRLSSWNKSAKGWSTVKSPSEPVRKLATSETISSVKFFADQPDTLVTGVKSQYVRIYDLREPPGNPSLQFATRCAHNLSIDTQDENYFASASSSGEPLICLWDRRWGPQLSAAMLSSSGQSPQQEQPEHPEALLEYNLAADHPGVAARSSIWSVRFSKAKRGSFGVLTSDGLLRIFETGRRWVKNDDGQHGRPHLLDTKRVRDLQYPVFDGLHSQPDPSRVISFDYMTYGRPEEEYSILTYRGDGSLKSFRLNSRPSPVQVDSAGNVIVGASPFGYEKHSGSGEAAQRSTASTLKASRTKPEDAEASPGLLNDSTNNINGKAEDLVLSSHQRHEQLLSLASGNTNLFSELITAESLLCRRAKENYLYDYNTNLKALSDDLWLQNMWEWVNRAGTDSRDGGMIRGRLDLSFLGVEAIWNRDLGLTATCRLRKNEDELPTAAEFRKAASVINGRRKRRKYDGVDTAFPDQRTLCLAICGWALPPDEFEVQLRSIAAEESKTKAAAWAMFNDMPRIATQLAMKGDEKEKLVAMALAGFFKQSGLSEDPNNEAWMELCQEVRKTAKDPWSRAILAYVTTEDWQAVLAEVSLPLRDRVGIALRYLRDDQLSVYLKGATADCIARGDIEGICLTGITDKAMDLFERYIPKANDVATAVLVMSIGCPMYVKDVRFLKWKRLYQNTLNAARLHVQRCEFEMQHMQRAITWEGQKLIQPPLRQISLRCSYCDRNLSHEDDTDTIISESSNAVTVADTAGSVVHAGNPLHGRGGIQGMAWSAEPSPPAGTIQPGGTEHAFQVHVIL
ncbi:MAG: Uridine nucleosidase 1 [Chaenotheca gracillima]|nr:MAG: Uridine nucleosidase 1 [Chaenotheca gracillima]